MKLWLLLPLSLVHSAAISSAPIVSSTNAKPIPHQYMVVLKKDVPFDAVQQHLAWVNQIAPFSVLIFH
jgi:hypothetical protein